jgi:hypothetical protein
MPRHVLCLVLKINITVVFKNSAQIKFLNTTNMLIELIWYLAVLSLAHSRLAQLSKADQIGCPSLQ